MSILRTALPLVVLLAISTSEAFRLDDQQCNGFQPLVYPKYSYGVYGTSIKVKAGSTTADCGNSIPISDLKKQPRIKYTRPDNPCSEGNGTLMMFDIDGGFQLIALQQDRVAKKLGGVLQGNIPSADSVVSSIKYVNTTNALLFYVNVDTEKLIKGKIVGDVIFDYEAPSRLPTDKVRTHRIVVAYNCINKRIDPFQVRLNHTIRRFFAPLEFVRNNPVGAINQGQWFTVDLPGPFEG